MEIIDQEQVSQEEYIKKKSNYLRGTIVKSLQNPLTGALAPDDVKLIKFHGSYQQHDRDLEAERKKQKLEPLYQFMVRVRVPGGITAPQQWLVLDELSDNYADGTLKLTTRQSFQFHGILKRNLKATIQSVNEAVMTTIATCGDVNRNVMCNPNPYQSKIHEEVYAYAKELSDYFIPNTSAYHEIWLDGKKIVGKDTEPIYKERYLPRKFKIALTIPPRNDIDVFANDLGFIAIEKEGKLKGFNVCVGGSLGNTLGDKSTYPKLGDVIGFIERENITKVAEKVISIQRDFGNRRERKNARMKYTIERMGLENFIQELNKRLGWVIAKPKPFDFTTNGDKYGWLKGVNNKWFYTLFIENGRVKDEKGYKLKSAIKEIASFHKGDFRLTGNQNLIIGNVSTGHKQKVEDSLSRYGVLDHKKLTGLRVSSMACVALNTCGLAFSESERYLPSLIDKADVIMEKYGLSDQTINIRMTGCPNGCARSYLGEIGFVGRAHGYYNMYLGASHNGDRLNTLYKEMLDEESILETLEILIKRYSEERIKGEHFGDFVIRKKIVPTAKRAIKILNE